MVNVLEFQTLVAWHKDQEKQGRPRGVFSDKHFVSSGPDNQHLSRDTGFPTMWHFDNCRLR